MTTLRTSLTCIDEQGCLIYNCIYHRFTDEYKTLIDLSLNNNPKCCWKRWSLTNQCIGGYDNEAYYDNTSCQYDVNTLVIERNQVVAQTIDINLQETVDSALLTLRTNDPSGSYVPYDKATEPAA